MDCKVSSCDCDGWAIYFAEDLLSSIRPRRRRVLVLITELVVKLMLSFGPGIFGLVLLLVNQRDQIRFLMSCISVSY